jgi:hypothetical protein
MPAGSLRLSRAPGASDAPPAWLLGFLIAITALRLITAGAIPLTEDEAYYRLWAASVSSATTTIRR